MKIFVKVSPKSKRQEIKKIGEFEYKVKLLSSPEKGKANLELVSLLAEYFGVSKNAVIITAGHTSKSKIVEINNLKK